jgi:hypothetical protein
MRIALLVGGLAGAWGCRPRPAGENALVHREVIEVQPRTPPARAYGRARPIPHSKLERTLITALSPILGVHHASLRALADELASVQAGDLPASLVDDVATAG